MQIDLVALIVDEYNPAIRFFTDILGFNLMEDSPSFTNDGRPKRWVVVRPPGAQTGLPLTRADGERQGAAIGDQAAGRAGFFLRVDDFDATYQRMTEAGVTFRSGTAHRTLWSGRGLPRRRWQPVGPSRRQLRRLGAVPKSAP